MNRRWRILLMGCWVVLLAVSSSRAEKDEQESSQQPVAEAFGGGGGGLPEHARPKRTLFLKKKLLGAGLLGFGLGVAKGYKAGYYHGGPEVHHVYVAPPPAVKYVEYVEKPVFLERIVERPAVLKSHPPPEFESSWSSPPAEASSPLYGSPW